MVWLNLNNKGAVQFSEGLALKAVSLLLALILWITILGFKREETKQNVIFEPLVAPGMMITSNIPHTIQFTLSGPRVLLKDVEKKIQPIRPDLRQSRESIVPIAISEDLLGELPMGVKVIGYSHNLISIRLEEIIERPVEVKPQLRGIADKGFVISDVKVTPHQVRVAGPRSLLNELRYVNTEVFDTTGLNNRREGVVAIEVDKERGFQLTEEKVVRVVVYARRLRGNP